LVVDSLHEEHPLGQPDDPADLLAVEVVYPFFLVAALLAPLVQRLTLAETSGVVSLFAA